MGFLTIQIRPHFDFGGGKSIHDLELLKTALKANGFSLAKIESAGSVSECEIWTHMLTEGPEIHWQAQYASCGMSGMKEWLTEQIIQNTRLHGEMNPSAHRIVASKI